MNIFVPVMCHTSPSRSARVRIAATSEPASGSVIAIAPIFSPAIAGRSHRSRCASEPNCASAGVAMSDCTEIAIAIAAAPARASSSMKTMPAARSPSPPPHCGGIVQAEEAELAAAPEEIVGEAPGRLPFVDVRPDLGLDEPAHRRPERVVLGGEDRMRRGHGKNAATSLIRS